MNRYQLVTTMHRDGYVQYGKRMIDSFLQYWPENQSLVVYTEGFDLEYNHANNARVVGRDLVASSPGLVDFKNRHKNNPAANGYRDPKRKDPDFAFDAVRFSHKVFALFHAFHNRLPGADAIIWIDADTVTHSPVAVDFLIKNFPLNADIGIYYLGRTQQHSECGWMVFNCLNSHMKAFWKQFVNQYRNDTLFELDEWHDSYVFDHVRTQFEKNNGMVNSNITPGYVKGHPFIDSFLGEYMDHLKGPKRKAAGRSAKHEAKNKRAGWWQ
jgi:hypothetical protein